MSDLLAKSMRLAPYAVAVFGVGSMLITAAHGLAIAYGTGAFVNGAATASPPYGLQSPIAGETK